MLPLLLLLACGAPAPEPAAAPPVALAPGDVVIVTTSEIAAGPRISGTLEPAASAVLRAEVGGTVESVRVELGDAVAKGDVLATLESSALRAALASAKAGVSSAAADLANMERELERIRRLHEAGALSARDLEQTESAVVAARARVEAAEAQQTGAAEQLEGATVRAPFAGVISRRDINQGDITAPGAALFTIIDPSTLRLEGAVPADSAGALAPGAGAAFTVQGMGDRVFAGQLQAASPAVDPTTRQIPVIVSLPNADGALRAGLFAEGRISAEARTALVLPTDALSGDAALRVVDGKVEKVALELGIRDEDADRVEVRAGLAAGDAVLVGPAREVKPGTTVTLPGSGT